MPSGRDLNLGRRGTGTTKRNAYCSFCRKSYRDVGPLVEGPGRRLHLRRMHRALPVDPRPGAAPPRRAQDALHRHPDPARDQGRSSTPT